VNRTARRATIIKATTVNVPATADLFDQKPLEAAATIGTVDVGDRFETCVSDVLILPLLLLLESNVDEDVDEDVAEVGVDVLLDVTACELVIGN